MSGAQGSRFARWVRTYVLATFAAIAVAAGCLALGKWQWDAAWAHQGRQLAAASQVVKPLGELTDPQQWLPRTSIGAQVRIEGTLLETSTFLTAPRPTVEGERPWVVTAVRTADDEVVAVVRGAGLPDSRASDVTFIGRLQPSEDSPAVGVWQPQADELSTGALVDRWPYPKILDGYVVAQAPLGLANGAAATPRFTAAPSGQVSWRNLAYAVQWALFAIFALFVWWRHLVTTREGE